jgi:hypothetical protein
MAVSVVSVYKLDQRTIISITPPICFIRRIRSTMLEVVFLLRASKITTLWAYVL